MLPEKNLETSIIAITFDDENGQDSTSIRVWPNYGYFNQQLSDFKLKRKNHPEIWIIYINQAYLTVKNNKRMFYGDHFILDQIIEAINQPEIFQGIPAKSARQKYISPVMTLPPDNF